MLEIQDRWVTFYPPEGATYLIGDFTDWDDKLIPLTGPVTYEFPRGAYVEYAYLDADKQPIADPTNPMRPKHPWHDFDRALTLPLNDYKEPPRPRTLRGHVYDHRMFSRVFDSQRTYSVYEPPLPPVATLYVHDGEGYYHKLCFHEVAEALLERGEIHPVRLVMIEPQDREEEYWFDERYETFLLRELLPEVDQRYGATKERALWGASLGGMISAWLAWRNPLLFSKVASQSGCFTADPEGGDEYHDPEWLTEQFAKTSHRPVRFYLETGQIEWLLAPNRRFAAMLADKGYVHNYQERPSGHNWTTWEQGLEPGLMYLFGVHNRPSLPFNAANALAIEVP
jgi:enterochelin esterase-like enzyme